MANFSTKERLIASMLSSSPKLKSFIKKVYISLNAVIYRKNYNIKISDSRVTGIERLPRDNDMESFFGYYDKSPENTKGDILVHQTKRPTKLKPSADYPIYVGVCNSLTGKMNQTDFSLSYTWQQGCRTQWLDDNLFIYNVYENGKYIAKVHSVAENKIVRIFDFPVQDAYKKDFFLSINYRRIMYLRPDYGYRNMIALSEDEMRKMDSDGIWIVDYNSGEHRLLHSLRQIVETGYRKPLFDKCLHAVNHVMINSSGTGFIFIHRYYLGMRRFDRLVYSDFNSMRILADNDMVSHCCWLDDNTVFGFLKYNGVTGFYFIDVKSGNVKPCETLTSLHLGDGHPSCKGDWIVVDTYPDKSRMQHLFLYNYKKEKIIHLLELYQSTKYMGECRCDLHPRFSMDGKRVFFDTVYDGRRGLCVADVSRICNE